MLSEEIRARIARLASTLPDAAAGSPRASGRPVQQHLRLTPAPAAAPASAVDLRAAEVQCTASGEHLRLRRKLVELWPAAADTVSRAVGLLASMSSPALLHPELAAVAEHFPARTMFLDLETCGFAGAPVFLAGLVWRDGESLIVDQLFARNYAEERALLETLGTIAAQQRVLATFNGKSFDWPMVCDRSVRHRLGAKAALPLRKPGAVAADTLVHCDLLHHARRRWKRVLPNCKLQTLERLICRRTRLGDLGGGEVPMAYHQFVRTGERAQIEAILLHNALDLVTLVEVTLRLLNPPAESQSPRVAAG